MGLGVLSVDLFWPMEYGARPFNGALVCFVGWPSIRVLVQGSFRVSNVPSGLRELRLGLEYLGVRALPGSFVLLVR